MKSQHCLDETNLALDAQLPAIAVHLVPTDLTPGLELRLSSHQAIFQHELSQSAYRDKLLAGMEVHLTQSGVSAQPGPAGAPGK